MDITFFGWGWGDVNLAVQKSLGNRKQNSLFYITTPPPTPWCGPGPYYSDSPLMSRL